MELIKCLFSKPGDLGRVAKEVPDWASTDVFLISVKEHYARFP